MGFLRAQTAKIFRGHRADYPDFARSNKTNAEPR